MAGSGGSSRGFALGADSSAYYLQSGEQTCAKQQETGRLRRHLSDLASDLSTREGGVVNIGVGVPAVQSGDEGRFRAPNGSTLQGDERRGVGASKGQVEGIVVGARRCIWEAGKWYRYWFVDSHRTAAM